jgi:protein ImuB
MFAVIYIPDFFLQAALRHEPELAKRAVALIDESLPKPVIVQLTEVAKLSGVCTGMTSTQAMARCRQIVIKSRSVAQETAATDTLLQSSYLFSPYVEATAPGICTLDLKGQNSGQWSADFSPLQCSTNRTPSESRDSTDVGTLKRTEVRAPMSLADDNNSKSSCILSVLGQFHLRAQVGVAPTPAVALHAARSAAPFFRVDDSAAFLDALPVESLAPSPQLLSILQKWGIRTIGEFLRLGKDALAERLGVEALELFSRASTKDIRPLKLTQPPESFEETFEFENEIESLEPLLFILRRFLDQLALRLSLASFAAEEILLRLMLSDGSNYERAFKIPAPTADANVLFRVLFTHLENVRTDHPIKGLYLWAKPCRPSAEQFGLFDCVLRDPNHFYETLGRLTALLGGDRIGIPVPLNVHRPDAFELHPPDFKESSDARSGNATASSSVRRHKMTNDQLPTNYQFSSSGLPLRRFRPPIPAQVELREKRPSTLRSALFHGPIRQSAGPWRASGQWWDNQLWQRDEWDIQADNGRLYRLFCERDGWFVEGVYD